MRRHNRQLTMKTVSGGAKRIEIELSVIKNGFPPSWSTRYRNPASCLPDYAFFRGRQPEFHHFLTVLDHFWVCHAVSRYVTLVRNGHLPVFLRSTHAENLKNVHFALCLGNRSSLGAFHFDFT